MPDADRLARLRRHLAAIEARDAGFSERPPPIPLGPPELDRELGGGLPRAALHEVLAAEGRDAPAATAFTLALARRALDPGRKLVWVRQDMATCETGALYPPGIAELGADPSAVILVRVRDPLSVLRAANEALRCAALGAVVIDIWGEPKPLDLTATRRLARAAEMASTTAFLIRAAATPVPSAAFSRWRVRAAPSRALAANAPGAPMFEVELMRHRAGLAPRRLCLEWDCHDNIFRAPLSEPVPALPARRPAASNRMRLRRAG